MSAHQDFVKNNEKYAKDLHKPNLPLPPSKNLLIVTCMDARIDRTLTYLMIDANSKDALRSIIIF
ncbi:hypothetical protein MPER_02264 [Moniliophthora perniciosa FA553]|nr:hypothetical protein MPER_02264 [Moniliophthora perniciosa FA553]